jgi:hypothetical protein
MREKENGIFIEKRDGEKSLSSVLLCQRKSLSLSFQAENSNKKNKKRGNSQS